MKMRTGISVVFQELHPVSVGFTLAISLLLNSVISNVSLTLGDKLFLSAHLIVLIFALAFFEAWEPTQKPKLVEGESEK